MKWVSFLMLILVLATGNLNSSGQSNPADVLGELSGTWKLDRSKSYPDDLLRAVLESDPLYVPMISIEQKWPAVTITETLVQSRVVKAGHQLSLFADGRGENDPIDLKVATEQDVAKVVDRKLIVLHFGLDEYRKKILVATTEYSVADDGKTLVRKLNAIRARNFHANEKVPAVVDSHLVFTRVK